MSKSKKSPFTTQENNYIIELVKQMGEDWKEISKRLPGRTPKQVHDRYINYLRDGLKRDPWTKQEEQILLTMYQSIGPKWSKMMTYLPGRSGNDIKNRWYKHIIKNPNMMSQINNSFPKLNNDSINININLTGLQKPERTPDNFILMNQGKQQAAPNSQDTPYIHAFNSLVEPIINKPEKTELTIPQNNSSNTQFNIPQHLYLNNNINNAQEVDVNLNNEQFNQEKQIEDTNGYVRLINKVEINYDNEFPNEIFGADQFNIFNTTAPEQDFILQDILSDVNSESLDLFWI